MGLCTDGGLYSPLFQTEGVEKASYLLNLDEIYAFAFSSCIPDIPIPFSQSVED